jgi:ABC-type transport system involved in cytochrome bd biosynthesis fused ATPase/permease subunit
MDMESLTPVILLAIFLFLAAVTLMFSHVLTWQRCQKENLDANELEYRRRQYRRRMFTSGTLGVLSLIMFVGCLLVIQWDSKVGGLVLWILVLLGLCWITVLAVVDIMATRRHFSDARSHQLVERVKLQAALQQIQASKSDSQAGRRYPENLDNLENLN